MKRMLLLPILLMTAFSHLFAQTQTVKGQITDKQSEMPLIGATIIWLGDVAQTGAVTDVDGYFFLENIPVGRHAFQVSYIGYSSLTIPNVVVTAGKEVVLNLALEESITKLDEVVVTASAEKDKAQNDLATISARQFSLEEVNRYSGGRSDVARLAGNFAGVSTPDDSRNDIVIRGNSPTGVLWRIEGIPIPNPNHFATFGTTGGPVSALNPNMLRNSDFLTSAFPAEYGNALAGVFDLGFRSGNRDNHEYTVQLGAVSGLEAMAEGPLGGGSYAVAGVTPLWASPKTQVCLSERMLHRIIRTLHSSWILRTARPGNSPCLASAASATSLFCTMKLMKRICSPRQMKTPTQKAVLASSACATT
ncbi:MAG: carboxypeptidase-like regulatory domain-containing protein [Saprospiraceae bacterium]|nr:carboxypeptidase-like regulatory domain-containing protein [Saprospiraceae bacterium]